MSRLPILIAVAVLLTLGNPHAEAQSALAARSALPPVIDGIIDDDEWQGATPLTDFIQLEPQKGAPAMQPTVGLFFFDDTHVYIAVTAYDDDPESITARLNNRDDPLTQDDSVTIYLDTFHDRRTSYFFATNPLSTQTDGRITDDGRVQDTTWDASWQAAARVTDNGWTAEFAIPLRVLQFVAGNDRVWGFNIGRTRRSSLEHSFWAGPLESARRVSQYGEIRGLALRGGAKRWDLIPYVQGSYQQGSATLGNAGLDLRYTFRPETVANFTLNPDFAIIEADKEFVNLTRFEVRLDEKRPFFLESNARFRQRIQTFYSRRIQDIEAGGKLLSRNGPWETTLLSVRSSPLDLTDEIPGREGFARANYTVARVERELHQSSAVAFQVANRSLGGENSGSMGLDTTLRLSRIMTFSGQLLRAYGPSEGGKWAYFARPAWDTPTFHFHFRYTHLGDRFAEDANSVGFISDDDQRLMDSDLRKVLWFEDQPVQRVELSSRNRIFWSQEGALRYYHNFETIEIEFRNRWTLVARHQNQFELFEKGFHNDEAEFGFGYNTREFQSWEVTYATGRNFDSDLRTLNARWSQKLGDSLSFEYQLSRVWLKPDPGRRASLINVFRVRQNFTRDLFVNVFFQTNSVIDRRNLEMVFVWRHKPPFGSIQFAFQRGRAAFGRRSDQPNTFFVKITHVL
ncbi:MAG: carbohydrate binding family 9 domain-containing protein [Acidobacteria bacterium]|nr:carbohydrate binding family 9 domain-containing protein [Acidobacteriota bacterium]